MQNLVKTGRIFYAIGIAGLGIQQFIYADLRPVFLPGWPARAAGQAVAAYLAGTALIVAAAIILFSKRAEKTAVVLGVTLLFLFIAIHVPHQLFFTGDPFNPGMWSSALKDLALSGCAFIIAGSFDDRGTSEGKGPWYAGLRNKYISWGCGFFGCMLVIFGIDHFLYTEFVASLVPAWIPGHIFWTYFAGVALVGSGLSLLLKIRVETVVFLLGIMIFLWFLMLHIPREVADPRSGEGNEVSSVFEALAFSGVAFIVAVIYRKRPHGSE